MVVMENVELPSAAANAGYVAKSKFGTSIPTLFDQVGQNKGKQMSEVAVVIVSACPLPYLDVTVASFLEG